MGEQVQLNNDLGPRSRLLSAFFDSLSEEKVSYAVMNNYEDLPRSIPSDVDFTVAPEFFEQLDGFIVSFASRHDALLVQKLWHGNQKCAYILCVGPKGGREFLQLDFFVSFSTKGCPALLTHEELIADKRKLRNFYIPTPSVEIVFIIMRRLFKDDWSERHCERISELRGRIAGKKLLPERFSWLSETLDAAISGDLSSLRTRRLTDWEKLRQTAREHMSLFERSANAATQTKRIAVRLRDETGQLVLLDGSTGPLTDKTKDILTEVFHRQVHLREETLSAKGGFARFILPARLALLKRRKGLIFLEVLPDQRRCRIFARWLNVLGLVDQVIKGVSGQNQVLPRVSISRVTSTADAIEAILLRQANKTARAIQIGGTQTSKRLS